MCSVKIIAHIHFKAMQAEKAYVVHFQTQENSDGSSH